MGEDARATGEHSFALGLNSKATEPYSYAIGDGAAAIDTYAIALGDYVVAGGGNAFATNDRTKAMGMGSASFGKETIARATYEVVIGSFNDTTYPIKDDYNFNVDNPAFVIGNGSGELMNGRSNAFSVYFNGRTIIGDGVPKAKLHVKKGNILVSDSSSGLILTSADDREWKVTVNNDGALKTERLPGEPSTR